MPRWQDQQDAGHFTPPFAGYGQKTYIFNVLALKKGSRLGMCAMGSCCLIFRQILWDD